MKPLIIGIAGGSASGKTTIARHLKETFEGVNSVSIIREDDYYKDQSDKTMEERVITNYDHPFAFDHELMIQQIDLLRDRVAIEKPTYDFVLHTRSSETEVIQPCDVIVLEGLFILEEEAIRDRLDIKVFVDTDADIRFIRRLRRDVIKRGRTMQSVIDQYTQTVKIMHDQFIEPSKRYADIIIPEGGHNVVAIDLLTTKISSIINSNML